MQLDSKLSWFSTVSRVGRPALDYVYFYCFLSKWLRDREATIRKYRTNAYFPRLESSEMVILKDCKTNPTRRLFSAISDLKKIWNHFYRIYTKWYIEIKYFGRILYCENKKNKTKKVKWSDTSCTLVCLFVLFLPCFVLLFFFFLFFGEKCSLYY